VLRTAIQNGEWDQRWKNTTRFIVDTYHYNNHKANDYMCQTWCNPTPSDGSQPNLIGEYVDENGVRHSVSLISML